MTVREYIGARYVPLFADPIEWDSTSDYEPLTVVTHEGGSYVSRRQVPSGIDISNTDYWLLWADYNAQLEAYRREVLTFDGRITANENAIETINENNWVETNRIKDSAVTTGKINNLAVTTPKIANSAITQEKLAVGLRKKTVVLLGDSYSSMSRPSERGYWDIGLEDELNLNVENMAVDGAGFTIGTTFLTQLANATTPANECAYIIVYGGINDAIQGLTDSSVIHNAVQTLVNAIKNKYPNKPIFYFGFNGCVRPNSQNNKLHWYCMTLGRQARRSFVQLGCPSYNAQWVLSLYDDDVVYNADKLHPSNAGANIIRAFILSILRGSKTKSLRYRDNLSNITDFIELNTGYSFTGDVAYYSFDGDTITLNVNIAGDLAYGGNEIGTLKLPFLLANHMQVNFVPQNSATYDKIREIRISANSDGYNTIRVTAKEAVTGASFRLFGIFQAS